MLLNKCPNADDPVNLAAVAEGNRARGLRLIYQALKRLCNVLEMQVRKQEMLLLEGVAAYGVSLLPAVHFQLPLWQEVLQRQQTEAAGAEAAAAADVLTVDAKRVSVFAESPELLGRALE